MFQQNIWNGFQLIVQTRVHGRNGYVQCSKGKPELRFLCSARRLIVLYIYVNFGENILVSIRVMKQTQMMEALMGKWTDGPSNISGLGATSKLNIHRDLGATQIWFRR